MSRREDRDSESRRRRSRFDGESSPKRSRRDGKAEAERSNPGSGDRAEQNEKQHRRLQDALPLEPPLGSDNKLYKSTSSKEATKKGHGDSEGAKHSSDPSEVLRSRSFSQYGERNHTMLGGRSSSLRTTSERGSWKDTRVHRDGKESEKKSRNDDSRREEKLRRGGGDAWKHDRFLEMESSPPPPSPPLTRKRPSFREQKNHNSDKSKPETSKMNGTDLHESERKDDKNHPYERTARGDEPRLYTRGDRYGGGGNRFRGRGESYNNARQPPQPPPHYNNRTSINTRVEKWKHDMFDEANRSPSPKKDEDRLAKIEALLAS